MADENTTDSTAATEATDQSATDQTGTPSDTSTTQTTDQKTDDEAPAKTLLTDDAKDTSDDKADSTADGTGEKGSDDKTAGDDKADETAELFGAPEGDYTLSLPEGVEVDTKALEAIAPVAKQLGLSDKGMSLIASTYAEKVLPGVVEGFEEQIQRNIAATHKEWADQTMELVKTDPAFKGEPLSAVQQTAAKAIDRFGGDELRKFFDETGGGNHPAMVRAFYLAGSAISEDTTFERGDKGSKPKSTVDKFYGEQT
jgi:hypothetical protein